MLNPVDVEIGKPVRVPSFVGWFNQLARAVLRIGPVMGPNALLTVRGRRTGEPRTTPVALVAIDGRTWVIGTFGEVNWVRNLRAAGEGTISVGRRSEHVVATELPVQERIAFFRDELGPYVRRLALGRVILSVLGAGEILEDPAGSAVKRPVFELKR